MSTSIDIFISVLEPIAKLVTLIEPLIPAKFNYFSDESHEFFEARTADSIISIGDHTFENDRDLNFEDFHYVITLRPIRDKLYAIHQSNALVEATSLFAKLKKSLKVNMMFVDNLQRKLDVYYPDSDL